MAGDDAAGRRPGGSESRPRDVPLLEWVLGVLGAALVAASVGYLLYQALAQPSSPPDVRLVAEEVVEQRNGYLVQFRATNEGRSTASQLTLEGELIDAGGETVETSETALDYLPGRSEREGGLFFTQDPRGFDLQLRPKGYVKP